MPLEFTTNRNYPLPHKDNKLQDDIARLRTALEMVGIDVQALDALIAQKAQASVLSLYQLLSAKDQPGGYAGLDVNGLISDQRVSAALKGGMRPQGEWNAATDTPALPVPSDLNKGFFWVVSADGTTSRGGITDWKAGDHIWTDGTTWLKIDNTDKVTSVAGRTGNVVIDKNDVTGIYNMRDYGSYIIPPGTTAVTFNEVGGNRNAYFELTGIIPQTNDAVLRMQFNNYVTGLPISSANYTTFRHGVGWNGSTFAHSVLTTNGNGTLILGGLGINGGVSNVAANGGFFGSINLLNLSEAARTQVMATYKFRDGGAFITAARQDGELQLLTEQAGLTLSFSTGNFAGGHIRVSAPSG